MLARNAQGERILTSYQEAQSQADAQPVVESLDFGNWGMGGSAPAGVRNQNHYSLGVDQSVWDRLGPGAKVTALSLGFASAVTVIRGPARDASGNRYMYIGAGAVSKKIRLDTLATVETKTFSHGTGTTISDICVLKDGASATGGVVSQPGDGFVLFAFGATACLVQVNLVGVNTTDTFSSTAATAYGGTLYLSQSTSNGQRTVWKSTGFSGQSTGPFCRLQSFAISSATADHSASATWTPATPLQVGDTGSSITGMAEYARGLAVAKPEGVYLFDPAGNNYIRFGTKGPISDLNGKNMAAWGQGVFVPTKKDLQAFGAGGGDGPVGLTLLASNTSPIQGYPSAFCTYGGESAYVSWYDGTDSYVCLLRQRKSQENVPNPYLVFPVAKVTSAQCQAMAVIEDASGVVRLFFSTGTDVSYIILDPPASRTYADAGTWYSRRLGDPRFKTTWSRLSVVAAGIAHSATITPALDLEEAGTYASGLTAVSASGHAAPTLTPGTSDSAYFARLRLTWSNGTSTDNPYLVGGSLVLEGWAQPAGVDVLEFEIEMGSWTGSRINTDAQTQYAALSALTSSGPVNVVYSDFYGDTSTHKMLIRSVRYIEGEADAEQAAQRRVHVKAIKLFGTT